MKCGAFKLMRYRMQGGLIEMFSLIAKSIDLAEVKRQLSQAVLRVVPPTNIVYENFYKYHVGNLFHKFESLYTRSPYRKPFFPKPAVKFAFQQLPEHQGRNYCIRDTRSPQPRTEPTSHP